MNDAAETVQSTNEEAAGVPQTLAELFTMSAERYGREDALNYKRDGAWQKISSSNFVERARNIALGLTSLGLRKGDRAAILAANSPEWTLADAGCQFAGIIDVPIYTTLAPEQVAYILNDSGARVLFLANREAHTQIAEALGRCGSIEKIVFFDGADADLDSAISLEDLEAAGARLKQDQPERADELTTITTGSDIATLIYTSGTTGEPKGVMLSHSNLISNVIAAAEQYSFGGLDVSLSVLPLSHVFERM